MPCKRFSGTMTFSPCVMVGMAGLVDLQPPSRQADAGANVEILAVHEITLVESADGGKGFGAEQHEESGYPGWRGRCRVSRFAPGENFTRCQQRAMRFGMAPGRLEDPGCQDRASQPGVRQQGRQDVAREPDIGVQDQEPGRFTTPESLVVVRAVTQGFWVADDLDRKSQPANQRSLRFLDIDRQQDLRDTAMTVKVEIVEKRLDQRPLPVTDDRDGDGRRKWRARGMRHGLISHAILVLPLG